MTSQIFIKHTRVCYEDNFHSRDEDLDGIDQYI